MLQLCDADFSSSFFNILIFLLLAFSAVCFSAVSNRSRWSWWLKQFVKPSASRPFPAKAFQRGARVCICRGPETTAKLPYEGQKIPSVSGTIIQSSGIQLSQLQDPGIALVQSIVSIRARSSERIVVE